MMPAKEKTKQASWVVVYVKHHFEKKVYQLLNSKQINAFLPIHKVLRNWSDRKKWVEMPLFQNYLFAKVSPHEYVKILETKGVFNLVNFQGEVAIVPDDEIEMVKRFLGTSNKLGVVDENLLSGELVVITKGTLMGIQGRMLTYKGKKRLAVNIEYLGKTILMDIPVEYVSRCMLSC